MTRPVDIHIHLTDEEYGGLLAHLKTQLKTTDIALVSVAVDLKTSERSLRIAEEFPGKVIPFIGVHPQMAGQTDPDRLSEFLDRMKYAATGLGEIGLDRRLGSKENLGEAQLNIFRIQLEAAERLGKPVSIHSRGTLKEILAMLPSYRLKRVLLHWFAGNKEELKESVDQGYYASFGPALVYSKNKRLLAASMPPENVLTETDGPVRFGGCFGGRMALPSFLPSVLFALAIALQKPYEEMESVIYANSQSYLGISL